MLAQYTQITYEPHAIDYLGNKYLAPRKRIKWGQLVKDCWQKVKEIVSPPYKNPFDVWDEVMQEMLWEAS